jgi:hypothetical protein
MPLHSINKHDVLPQNIMFVYCFNRAAANYIKVTDTLLHGISFHLIKHATLL